MIASKLPAILRVMRLFTCFASASLLVASIGDADKYAEGVIDAKGVEVIPPGTAFFVTDITDATALLQFAHKFLFVDLDKGPVDVAEFADTKGFDWAEPFWSGLALVKVGEEQFYIDVDGGRPLKETYEHAETLHSDRALVYNGGRKRIIGSEGPHRRGAHV